MDTTPIVDIFNHFFIEGVLVLMPVLVVSLVVVLLVAIAMAVMQIQEQTLTFVPKLLAFIVLMVILGPFIFDQLLTLFNEHLDAIPKLTQVKWVEK